MKKLKNKLRKAFSIFFNPNKIKLRSFWWFFTLEEILIYINIKRRMLIGKQQIEKMIVLIFAKVYFPLLSLS